MKIGLDARAAIWYRGTGIGTYTYQLLRNLYILDKENEYRFFWPGDEYKDLDPRDEVFSSIEKSKDKFWEEVHIPLAIESEGIDLYHVPQNGIGLPVEKKCPFVVTIHDLIPYIYPETVGKGYLKLFLEQMPRIIQDADKIIAVSQCSKKDIQKMFKLPEERISVIYEAPEEFYKPMDKGLARKLVADKYGLSKDFIMYIGGFSPRKNLKGLINAYYEVYKDLRKDHQLVFVGKPSREYAELKMLVDALGMAQQVVFTGFVPVEDMPFLYNAANIFVYPSFYEGFGLPPLEAMACGTPTIVSNTSSIPEVVGKSALLIDPYDTLQLAAAIYRLVEDESLAASLAKKGLRRAKTFNWRKTALQTKAVYQEMVQPQRLYQAEY